MGCAQSYKHPTGKSRKGILFDGVGEALQPLHQEKEQKDSFNIDEFLKLIE